LNSPSSPPVIRYVFLLPLLFLSPPSRAQDKINLMNGQVLEGKVLGQSTLEVRYQIRKGLKLLEKS
jgi:hypothetical protein